MAGRHLDRGAEGRDREWRVGQMPFEGCGRAGQVGPVESARNFLSEPPTALDGLLGVAGQDRGVPVADPSVDVQRHKHRVEGLDRPEGEPVRLP
jgi:hypothetical protein